MEVIKNSMERKKERLMLITLIISLCFGCESDRLYLLEGGWRVAYFEDENYTPERHILDNMVNFIKNGDKLEASFPRISDPWYPNVHLKDMHYWEDAGKEYLSFEYEPRHLLFSDTFEILYLTKDSFVIKSKVFELGCVRW